MMSDFQKTIQLDRFRALKAIAEDALKEAEAAVKVSSDSTEIAVLMERMRWTKKILGK
jgi:hypothetical protein